MEHSEPGTVSRRPHHISSIAHHFLGEGCADPSAGEVPAVRRCAIAAAGGAAISAFAAAGLVMGSPGSSTLSEDGLIRWSAGTYFRAENGTSRIRRDAGDGRMNMWRAAPAAGKPLRAPAPEIHWNHLGCLGPAELSLLESEAASRTGTPSPAACRGGLVWCLQEDDAGRLGTSYFLGRLAEVLKPRRIEILLFPNAWSSAGRPGWLDEIRNVSSLRYDSENLAPLVSLAKKACGGIAPGIHQVSGADNLAANFSGADQPDSLWSRVPLAMISDPAEC